MANFVKQQWGWMADRVAGILGLKVLSTALSYLVTLILANALGRSGYGAYAFAVSWVVLLAVPAMAGLDSLLIREVARYQHTSRWSALRGLLRWSVGLVSVASILMVIGGELAFSFGLASIEAPLQSTTRIALLFLPLVTLMSLQESTLRGLDHVLIGFIPSLLVRPLFVLISIVVTGALLPDSMSPEFAILLYGAGAVAGCVVASISLARRIPSAALSEAPAYAPQAWLSEAWPLLLFGLFNTMTTRIDIVMLGIIRGAAEPGLYSVASRLATLVGFPLLSVNSAMAPRITHLHVDGNMDELQDLVTKSAHFGLLASLPIAGILMVGGKQILRFFGPGFSEGKEALALLTLGQIANTATGPAARLLIMTGCSRELSVGVGIGAFLNVALNLILIPGYGILGAAVARVASTLTSHLLLAYFAYRRFGIVSTALRGRRKASRA